MQEEIQEEMQGTTFKDYKFLLLKETKGKKSRGKKNAENWQDQMQSLIEQNGGEMSDELCEGMTVVVEDRASVASQVKALIKANKVTEQFFSSL